MGSGEKLIELIRTRRGHPSLLIAPKEIATSCPIHCHGRKAAFNLQFARETLKQPASKERKTRLTASRHFLDPRFCRKLPREVDQE